MATGKRHAPNRPPCSKLAESCGGSVDSELRQVSFYVTVGAIVHEDLGSMASRSYLLFGRSIARPLFAPLGFESMLV